MKFNKNILVLMLVMTGFSTAGLAQHHILVGMGQNLTNFRYIDDNDELDTSYNPQYSSSFNLGYAYSLDVGVYFHSKIGVRNAGASYVYDDYNYIWNIRYGEFRLGAGYRYDFGSLYTQFAVEGYLAYAMNAEQQLYNVDRDMIAAGTIERLDVGMFFSPGVGYGLTDNVAMELDINYMLGLGNIDKDENQITRNRLWGLSLGLNIKI